MHTKLNIRGTTYFQMVGGEGGVEHIRERKQIWPKIIINKLKGVQMLIELYILLIFQKSVT